MWSLINRFKPDQYKMVCSFCYPNHYEEMGERPEFKNINYGDFNQVEKTIELEKEFEKDRIKTVILLDEEHDIYCCKEHLLEMASLIDEADKKGYDASGKRIE